MSTNASSERVQRFGGFEVDPRSRELRRKGKTVRLQEKPLQVLLLLLERRGEVVTRQELKQRLWPADTFVDSDDGLNTAIRKLREVLGDSAEKPIYIETIPRRGYRLNAEVEEAPIQAESAILSGTTLPAVLSGAGETRSARRWPWVLAPGIAVVIAACATWIAVHAYRKYTTGTAITSLAVLPLDNLSGDPSQQYLADAITDELISELGKIRSLRVISRTSSNSYRGTRETIRQVARELKVDGVIAGSVLRSGDRVHVTVQLISEPSGRNLWSGSYESDLKDLLVLQSELAHTIAGQVRAAITPAEEEYLHPDSVNPEAYEAYMHGRFSLDKWPREDSEEALHFFQRAAELDSKYALAYAGIADCYIHGVPGLSNEEQTERGIAAASRALELNPDLGKAHAMLGVLRMRGDWDFKGAEAEIKKGIALSPNYAPAYLWYSHLLMDLGRYSESLVEEKKLIELDPFPITPNGHLAYYYLATRQWDLAIAHLHVALAKDPSQYGDLSELGEAYLGKHMYQAAIAQLSRAAEMARSGTQYPLYLARLGYARGRAGDVAGAKNILSQLPSDDLNEAAYVYAGLGDRDKSIALLNEAYRRHTFRLDAGYIVELDPLRSDPRLNELLHRVGLR